MKAWHYVTYFGYIAWHWNLRLAIFTLYHEIRGERKYRLHTSRLNHLTHLTIKGGNLDQAEMYQGAGYYLLDAAFTALKNLQATGGFVDVGCGKGRVLVVAAHHGFTDITGVDFAKELCFEATSNCNNARKIFPGVSCKVFHLDAANYTLTKNQQVIFLFNPFKQAVMARVIHNLLASRKSDRRTLWVVYLNPQHKHLFLQSGFTQVWQKNKMPFVEACILTLTG